VAAGRKKKADTELILALACGATHESAAQKAGLSLRTIYRRLENPGFREQVQQVRADIVRRVAGLFTAAGMSSFKTFTYLQESAGSESVRLGAARAVIELGCKLRKTVELTERLAAMEAQMRSLLEDLGQPASVPTRGPVKKTGE
jgi:hypothetical protein